MDALIAEAREAQVKQTGFTQMKSDPRLEQRFRESVVVLRDPETGKTIQTLEQTLFIYFEYQFSEALGRSKSSLRTKALTSKAFYHWLSGYSRDRGSGKPGDAFCARYDIIDPTTGEAAKFTAHDVRHWLDTMYENGGLSQEQIAIVFNRQGTASNSVYDQTGFDVRKGRLRDAVAGRAIVGHVGEVFERIAAEDREEAAQYLETALRFYNPMPHGICQLNWALEPCPNALSCFACSNESNEVQALCEHLIIDTGDKSQMAEVRLIHNNARNKLRILEEEGLESSPQFERESRILTATLEVLEREARS